jgi:hypothetical protein
VYIYIHKHTYLVGGFEGLAKLEVRFAVEVHGLKEGGAVRGRGSEQD